MNQDLQKTLWATADKLRSNMDAAEYKHVVLGLIFLKYISDAFGERKEELPSTVLLFIATSWRFFRPSNRH
jgi:type I restriction enzyme M protein